ncbi:hypothetical protein HKK74_13630 [Actinomadura alba]|uniref:Uncharacterized protein n=2 Tax=Actinomadura alba TaxID=406431 RepID=A0ABR7LNV3_9ACTN|nr:hypothetical protein [Actinomadura alba]
MFPRTAGRRLTAAAGLALAIAAALFAFGRIHTPDFASSLFGRRGDDANVLKAQLGTGLLGLALYQLTLALWMYQRLPGAGAAPRPVHPAHRIGGAVLFALSLPIAYHCITAYGVQTSSARVALHSLAGCFFYGAFAAKVLLVRSRHLPGWALPLAGGTLVTLIVTLWSSGALWQFTQP